MLMPIKCPLFKQKNLSYSDTQVCDGHAKHEVCSFLQIGVEHFLVI